MKNFADEQTWLKTAHPRICCGGNRTSGLQ